LHVNATLVQTATPAILEEVLASTPLKNAVILRISPTAVLADPWVADLIIQILIKKGYSPKVIAAPEQKEASVS